MPLPKVVNMRTCSPPWGQPGDVKIDRTSIWGNPYPLPSERQRDFVIDMYEKYLRQNQVLLASLPSLAKAKRLGCFCKPRRCHGDVLVKIMKEQGLAE